MELALKTIIDGLIKDHRRAYKKYTFLLKSLAKLTAFPSIADSDAINRISTKIQRQLAVIGYINQKINQLSKNT